MSDELAPIALFVYNRPVHTKRLLQLLAEDSLARMSVLNVFSDAPKHPSQVAAVTEVRHLIKSVSGFRRVNVFERTENLGLAGSIIAGVTELCRTYGRVIVLEDDLLVSPHFLAYMNDALERYKQELKIMAISGYMYPVNHPEQLPNMFFCPIPTSWGWATWERAWVNFEPNSEILADKLRQEGLQNAFDMEGSYPYFLTLLAHARGELDVWGVRWYASVFLRGGLCLYPAYSLVHNAGMDGSGVHCGMSTEFDVDLLRSKPGLFPERIEECRPAVRQIIEFFRTRKKPRLVRTLRRIYQHLFQ